MSLLVVNAGEKLLLEWIFKSTGGALTLRLFANNATISATMVVADLTEASFTGYTARTLARASFGSVATNADEKAEIAYSVDQLYQFGSNQAIYGYYLTDASNNLVAVRKFNSVKNFTSGAEYLIQPRFTFTTLGSAAAVITNYGERVFLDWILKNASPGALTMRLFKNNLSSFTGSTVAADLTQADFSGYAAVALARASWNAAATDGAGVAQIEFNTDPTFSPAADQAIYGWYATDATNEVVMGQKFTAVQNLESGEDFSVPLSVGLRSEV